MKNIAFATLAIVTLTMFAASTAQAQSGRYGTYNSWNASPYATPASNYILPAATSNYRSSCPNGNCATGSCATGACVNGRCGTQVPYGTTTGYRGAYGANWQNGFGSTLASWFGLRPSQSSVCPNGRCYNSPSVTQYNTAPYVPSSYGMPGYSGSMTPRPSGSNPYYGSY